MQKWHTNDEMQSVTQQKCKLVYANAKRKSFDIEIDWLIIDDVICRRSDSLVFRRRGWVRSRDQFWRAHRPLGSALSDSAPHVKNRYRLSAQNLHRPGKLKRDDELNSQWTTYCIPSGRHVCWPTLGKSRAPLITETADLSIFIGDKRRYWTLFGKQDDARSRIIKCRWRLSNVLCEVISPIEMWDP